MGETRSLWEEDQATKRGHHTSKGKETHDGRSWELGLSVVDLIFLGLRTCMGEINLGHNNVFSFFIMFLHG